RTAHLVARRTVHRHPQTGPAGRRDRRGRVLPRCRADRLMCVAALAAGAREAVRMIRWRARVVGWAPILGPLLAVGLALLYTVFADQTLATVLEATRI